MSDKPPVFTLDDTPPRRGPGRPKGSTNATAAQTSSALNADVKKAMGVLDSMYNMGTLGLTIAGFHRSAADWTDSAEGLRKSNEEALRAAPKVAKAIANMGNTGGAATLIITHAMALASLTKVLADERNEKRIAAQAAMAEEQATGAADHLYGTGFPV